MEHLLYILITQLNISSLSHRDDISSMDHINIVEPLLRAPPIGHFLAPLMGIIMLIFIEDILSSWDGLEMSDKGLKI